MEETFLSVMKSLLHILRDRDKAWGFASTGLMKHRGVPILDRPEGRGRAK